MTEEVAQLAEVSAPEQEATAAPAPEVQQPEEAEQQPPKTFTQEELDAQIGKRLAREQRKWQREAEQRIAAEVAKYQPNPQQDADAPTSDKFSTTEEYVDALADWKVGQKLAEQERRSKEQAERQAAEARLHDYQDREESAREKYGDFEQVAYNPRLPITDAMAQTIQASEIGPDIAYFLGKNPGEAERIAGLSPFLQAKELGRLEAKLSAEPPAPAKKPSKAPAPISPVSARGSAPAFDTTDPRSASQMSPSEWIAAERERQRQKAAARGTR